MSDRLTGFIRFVMVGMITAVIYLLMGYLLSKYSPLGAINSANIAFVTAVTINYGFHHAFTFQKKTTHQHSLPRFVATMAVGFVVNALVVWVSISLFELQQIIAQIIAMLIVIASNFVLFSFWVFPEANNKHNIL